MGEVGKEGKGRGERKGAKKGWKEGVCVERLLPPKQKGEERKLKVVVTFSFLDLAVSQSLFFFFKKTINHK